MVYYSTGKSPFERRRGIPCEPHPNTAESLVKKGYLVRSLAELESVKEESVKEEAVPAVTHPDIIPSVEVNFVKPKQVRKAKPKKDKKVTKK